MKYKSFIILFLGSILLLYSVSAEYYIDVYTDSMTEASFNNNGVTIHKLNDNVWRLNSTLPNYADQRASVIKVFYDNYLSAGNITRIEVSNATDINKRALLAAVDVSFPSGYTGPRAIIIDTDVNFTTPGNVSSWYYLSTQTNSGMGTGGGSISTYSVDGSEVESISSNGIGASSIETTYYEGNYVNDTPVSTNLYTFLRVTTTSTTIGRTITRALYFTESDAVRTYTQSSSGFVSVNTNSFIDYYANYSIPKFNSTTLLVSALNNYPFNNTPLNQSTNLSYNLYHVEGFANCSIYVNGVLKEEVTGQSSGSNTIYYNTSYGTQGSNLVNISCVDDSYSSMTYKYLYVDTIAPVINYIYYYNGTGYSNLSNVTSQIIPLNLKINVSDINLYSFNLSITGTGYDFNYYNDTITPDYVYNDDFLLESDDYVLTVKAKDRYNNTLINTISQTINFTYIRYNYTIYLVDEQTGDPFNVELIESAILYDDDDSFLFDFQVTNVSSYNFIGESTGKRRIELKYSDGAVINRYIELNITGLNVSICANYENVTHYEQYILSSRERKVKMISQFANCYVAADYTRFAYGESYLLKAFTTDRPYTLRVWTDNVETDLAGLDGGLSTEIYLDVLEFAQQGYNINILSDTLNFEKREGFNNTIYIQYFNLREDLEDVSVVITNLDNDMVVYTSSTFDNPNEWNIAFDYSLLDVNETTLFKIELTKTDLTGLESSMTRYFNTLTSVGIINSKFAIVLAVILLIFGLTFTTVNITLSWFGIIIDLLVIVILSLAIGTWYITFLMGLTFIFLIYKIIIMTQKNITTIA